MVFYWGVKAFPLKSTDRHKAETQNEKLHLVLGKRKKKTLIRRVEK